MVKDAYFLPRINDLIDKLIRKKLFIKMDIQITMSQHVKGMNGKPHPLASLDSIIVKLKEFLKVNLKEGIQKKNKD